MNEEKAVAIVGLGAILPDARTVEEFWNNILAARYSIADVPADRWRVEDYFDPDASVPDKTYTKIGGWVREFSFEPLKWGIPIPPRMQQTMDLAQQWAIAATRQALLDYGYPEKRSFDPARVAVIFGNAMAGENHYLTSLRIRLPEFTNALSETPAFRALPADVQRQLVEGMQNTIRSQIAPITEDTMPGELGNIIAGRVANVFNFAGPNFVTDAACASSLAALQAAVEGLNDHQFDAVVTGGVDRNMGVESYVKFCKIGALSPDGSRPYSDGANGFVMGEGAGVFLLKRLADAERDGDPIYAVVRGIGSSSDGKGKGITAPNPLGQQRAIERAWQNAGVSPASAGMVEGHGTSTKVGDVVEVNSLNAIFGPLGMKQGSVALGSVKSNIGHLKSAAGAAGMLKTTLALHGKILPPTANFRNPNPNIDFASLPFFVNTEAQPWEKPEGEIRRAAVSSFGFGGTNFHVVMEEYVPGLLTGKGKIHPAAVAPVMADVETAPAAVVAMAASADSFPQPYRGLLFLAAGTVEELKARLVSVMDQVRSGNLPASVLPAEEELSLPERLAMDYSGADDLLKRAEKTLLTFDLNTPAAWQALTGHGVYRGSGTAGKVAFLFPGQGSQYTNMLRELAEIEPVVAETYREADRVMTPILGKPLTAYIFAEGDEAAIKAAEAALRDTTITQPAVLTANVALLRLMAKYGFKPDIVVGHSLGEYAALVASGVLSFAEALEVVSARGREMSKVSVADNGAMAAVSAPIEEVQRVLEGIDGYVVIANINSPVQSVIAGATSAVDSAISAFGAAGFHATRIPVSHAFHSKIVAPASAPLRKVIERMSLQAPQIPVVANVTGKLYPTGHEEMLELLAQQVASPVQFIEGVKTLYEYGARVFVEVGPKRVLNALLSDNLKDKPDVVLLATNHPRKGALPSFNEALCGLYAAGVGAPRHESAAEVAEAAADSIEVQAVQPAHAPVIAAATATDGRLPLTGSVVISGAGLGLPGSGWNVFSDSNIEAILRGDMRIEPLPESVRQEMLERRVTRLEKSDAGASMVEIDQMEQTIKLAGQRGAFDINAEFGIPAERTDAWDIATKLAVAAGIEALRDAGIPLVMRYRRTSKGTFLPDRWMLPEPLADETGVIFASAFPGLESLAAEMASFAEYKKLQAQRDELQNVLSRLNGGQPELRKSLEDRIQGLEGEISSVDYHFDRRFLFRILAMGHSQFAEYIGARGPNTQVNAACATTTQAVGIAEDWIRNGRCRRVVIVAGDDVTDGNLGEWITTGFLASGASTTEGEIDKAVLPFDRRRNGMIMGMGAAALVVESEDAVRERGMRGICEVIAAHTANSAFHGTRLDVPHVSSVMQRLIAQAEQRFGIQRADIAAQTVFVSHETYTPARGGSAAAEICALRETFGEHANQVVIANTKGFTGHSMGVGLEDVVAVKALEAGIVPPIANIHNGFEPDPDLGDLNLSKGGEYPVQYSLRLGAGFGSQIAMTLLRKVAGAGERVHRPTYQQWLMDVTGSDQADLEVEKRTLRVRQTGPAKREARASTWSYGQGPTLWANQQPVAVETAVGKENNAHSQEVKQADAAIEMVTADQPENAEPQIAVVVPDAGEVMAFVLSAVSEKTGYPPEMLDADLDLEGDLGIDTVKQAELFASIRTHFGIPRQENLRLSDYNTLSKVAQFVHDFSHLASGGVETIARPIVEVEKPAEEPSEPALHTPAVLPAVSEEEVKAYVLGVVAEKTGYPVEMLDLDLDLEGDLGIDTVKQAELFATIRGHYGIARREDLRLSDYNTLAKVIGFMRDGLPQEGGAAPAVQPEVSEALAKLEPVSADDPAPAMQHAESPIAVAAPPVSGVQVDEESVKAYVLSAVSEKTGYPVEMLDLDLDLEGDLGIDTVKQAELFATIRTHYGIPRREDLRLSDYNTLAKVIGFMHDGLPAATSNELVVASAEPAVEEITTEQPVERTNEAFQPVVEVDEAAIKAYVLEAVSEKTGYPIEMLDLDLDLEGDLGVDTVKQAELFATIRTHFGVARREDLRLSDYNTLAKVIGFMQEAQARPAVHTEASKAETVEQPVATPQATEPITAVSDPAPTPQPAPNAVVIATGEDVHVFVLQAVSEKTGYPVEMLDLDLDLEGDLGIDTVKQAELFATIRTHYNIPRREDLRLSDYNTLSKVIGFMEAAISERAAQPAEETLPALPEVEEVEPDGSITRRVVVPVLRPRLDLCLPTGVQLQQGANVVVLAGPQAETEALVHVLASRQVKTLVLEETSDDVTSALEFLRDAGEPGLYDLRALKPEQPLTHTGAREWNQQLTRRLITLYSLVRDVDLKFLVIATRMNGVFGLQGDPSPDTLGAAARGFAKAVSRERTNCQVKVVDFERHLGENELAVRLAAETRLDPGCVEVGWEGEQRYSLVAQEQPLPAEGIYNLAKGSVFLVSGGSGGITSPVLVDLARRTKGIFYLLARTALRDRDDADLQALQTDRAGLQKALIARLSQNGERVTPAVVEQQLVGLERALAARQAVEVIQAAGGTAHYLAVDVTDAAAVEGAVQQVIKEAGRVDVVIHAAGIERSRKIESKPQQEFEQTIAIKAGGLVNLIKAMESSRSLPSAVVMFTSVAGRYGNAGQTDYSAANDILSRLATVLPQQYPGMRAVAIDWGAWAEVGMASRGSIPEIMRRAGIDQMDPRQAAPLVYRELTRGNSAEIVYAGSLGMLEQAEDPAGGLDVAAANRALTEGEPVHVMFSRVTGLSLREGVTLEAELDPDEPFLKDHAMNGIPLLPGVMGIEGFSIAARHVASVLGSHQHGFRVAQLDDIAFLAPFKLYRSERRKITWKAQVVREAEGLVAHVILESALALKVRPSEVVRHFSGKVHLVPVNVQPAEKIVEPPHWNGAYTVEGEDIYRLYFHGPAFQVLEGVQRSADGVLGKLRKDRPGITQNEQELLSTPVLVELCLQTAGIWEVGTTGVLGLPHQIDRLRLYRTSPNGVPIYAQVQPGSDQQGNPCFDARVVDAKGRLYLEIDGYRTSPLPYSVEDHLLDPLKALVEGEG